MSNENESSDAEPSPIDIALNALNPECVQPLDEAETLFLVLTKTADVMLVKITIPEDPNDPVIKVMVMPMGAGAESVVALASIFEHFKSHLPDIAGNTLAKHAPKRSIH